ncbi:hypothetical protein KC366_g60 [Hortaea werneckii]|nr:hypothetical protein KC366_g60 [Hortaea werneckii]
MQSLLMSLRQPPTRLSIGLKHPFLVDELVPVERQHVVDTEVGSGVESIEPTAIGKSIVLVRVKADLEMASGVEHVGMSEDAFARHCRGRIRKRHGVGRTSIWASHSGLHHGCKAGAPGTQKHVVSLITVDRQSQLCGQGGVGLNRHCEGAMSSRTRDRGGVDPDITSFGTEIDQVISAEVGGRVLVGESVDVWDEGTHNLCPGGMTPMRDAVRFSQYRPTRD